MTRDRIAFVPKGATRFWPFVVGTSRASCPPPWNAELLLCRSLLEALLHSQPTESREHWRTLHRDTLAVLMHEGAAGVNHPSRKFVASLIHKGESILDVGCGAGVGYEALAAVGLESRYVGIDSSEPSVEIACEFYPAGNFRVGKATSLVAGLGSMSFDVVLVRHVLEHLPDFETAMNEAISVSRRLAVFVFFLTPRALPFGVRKIDLCINGTVFYNYVYSRRAINRFLAQSRLHWQWFDNLGLSRAGWFAGETNSVLIVSRDKSQLAEVAVRAPGGDAV
jgi:ubiquinone/menaquinone biosynthesis C-methylase UbiE